MSVTGEQRRLVRRGQKLAREAAVALAQAAEAAERSTANVVDQMTCTHRADAFIAAARIEQALREHGQVDVLVIPTTTARDRAQEDTDGYEDPRVQR
ncbi:MAG: hypothetical protein M0P31_18720 [Solirubrobacteraceae bacterium]|nr:hypothetical protein [Solirubrobacteraceae bacterium]